MPNNYKEIILKSKGSKLPIFWFYHTFIVQNFKITHFSSNNYQGIVLKIGVQNSLESAFMKDMS